MIFRSNLTSTHSTHLPMFSSRPSSDLFTELQSGETHQIYATSGQPLVLFSEVDATSLASIHFSPSGRYGAKVHKEAKALIAPYPGKDQEDVQRFQGLINKDSQEFELTITNLCSKGMINFNLLKTNDAVTETNPGGLNEINELRPFESYTVRCDQMNNLPLILQKFRDSVTKQSMTVEKDETEQKEKKIASKGTNIFLSVVPQESVKELVARFAKTVWKVSDIVVIQHTKPPAPVYRGWGGRERGIVLESSGPVRAMGYTGYRGGEESAYFGGVPESATVTRGFGSRGIHLESAPASASARAPGSASVSADYMLDQISRQRDTMNESKSKSMSKGFVAADMARAESNDDDVDDLEEEECDDDSDSDDSPLVLSRAVPRTYESSRFVAESARCESASYESRSNSRSVAKSAYKTNVNQNTVKQSEIGTIAYGDEHIDVRSAQTGIDYDYTVPSRPCVLGLSISENLEFTKVDLKQKITDLTEDAKKLLDDIVNKKFEDFLKGKIYVSDQCTICLNENPDCVLYNCAHRCGHYDCMVTLSRCPVCRNHVSAKLRQESTSITVVPRTQTQTQTQGAAVSESLSS